MLGASVQPSRWRGEHGHTILVVDMSGEPNLIRRV